MPDFVGFFIHQREHLGILDVALGLLRQQATINETFECLDLKSINMIDKFHLSRGIEAPRQRES